MNPLVALRDVCVRKTGVATPSSTPDAPFQYVDITAVDTAHKRIMGARTLLGRDAPSRARNLIRACDVLVATTRPNLNAVALVPDELDGEVCSTGFCVLRAGPNVHPAYLFLFAQSRSFVAPLSELVSGALYPAVRDSDVLDQRIPLPSLQEQKRIAAELTAALAEVDKARRAAQESLAAAQALPAAYLRAVFEALMVAGWSTLRLDETCDLLPSKSIATAGDTEVRAVTTACLSEGGFLSGGVKTARMHAADVDECVVRPNEVLFARSNTPALVGRTAMYRGEPPDVVASDLTIRIWARDGLIPEYLAAFLSYLYQTGHWRERAGGASGSMKKIRREQVLALRIPVPPGDALTEQRRIVADLSRRLESAEALIARCREKLAAIDALPAALLRQAFGAPAAHP